MTSLSVSVGFRVAFMRVFVFMFCVVVGQPQVCHVSTTPRTSPRIEEAPSLEPSAHRWVTAVLTLIAHGVVRELCAAVGVMTLPHTRTLTLLDNMI